MKTWTATLVSVSHAAYAGHGDFRATMRATGRFSTEALVAVAEEAIAGMTAAEKAKYGPTRGGFANARDNAVWTLCSWTHAVRMREWSDAYEKARAAAVAEFPSALEALGANRGA